MAEPQVEVTGDGSESIVTIGRSGQEFNELLEFYYPDEGLRKEMIGRILFALIDDGKLEGSRVWLTPASLDLTDTAIEQEFGQE